ncbi:MAG: hypothetical protein EBU40_09215 [Proteobacteria bacterium]|nr:hypothetical protein [Pseudomonadota bacterium]
MALIVISLLVAGALVLTWRVAEVPREMTSDHAEKLLDVQDVLDGQYRIFFPRNTGREAMQFYLIALMTPLAGVSYLTMRRSVQPLPISFSSACAIGTVMTSYCWVW